MVVLLVTVGVDLMVAAVVVLVNVSVVDVDLVLMVVSTSAMTTAENSMCWPVSSVAEMKAKMMEGGGGRVGRTRSMALPPPDRQHASLKLAHLAHCLCW
jgi:hypothetical protein